MPASDIAVHVRAHIRYAGTDTALIVAAYSVIPGEPRSGETRNPYPQTGVMDSGPPPAAASGMTIEKMQSAFEAAHLARFGFVDTTKQLVVEAVSVEAVGGGAKFAEPTLPLTDAPPPAPARRTRFFSSGHWHDAGVFTRDQLAPGHKVAGPAIIIEPHQTIVVEHGWQAELTAKNHLVLARIVPLVRTPPSARTPIR